MKQINVCEFTLIRASLRFVIRLHGRNVDGINVISCRTSQTYHHKINAKQREEYHLRLFLLILTRFSFFEKRFGCNFKGIRPTTTRFVPCSYIRPPLLDRVSLKSSTRATVAILLHEAQAIRYISSYSCPKMIYQVSKKLEPHNVNFMERIFY